MAITQISKIQLRRGLQADLPGAPITTIPPSFSPGLDIGELAFTTDTGRLFVGTDPTVGDFTYNRIGFPYQNIEVLTENSMPRLQTLHDGFAQDMQSAYIKSVGVSGAGLPTNSGPTDWTTITIPNPTDPTLSPVMLELGIPGNIGVYDQITYFVVNNATTVPVRVGVMSVIWDGGVDAPWLVDDVVASRRVTIGTDTSIDPLAVYGSLSFRVLMTTDGPNTVLVLQACNLTLGNPHLYYRIERPAIF